MSRARSHWTAAAAVAIALSAVHTWPLVTSPARLSLNYNGDVMLNEWILAWVQHQLPRAPLRLFQANIFHPARDVLAFSEPLILPALLGSPVRALGASPVLVHNLLLLAGLALTMLAGYALVRHWTGDPVASLAAAAAFTFNTHSLSRLEHLQAAHLYGLPLAVLAADRLITTGARREALWLTACMIGMAYTSGYLVVITTVALLVLATVRAREAWQKRRSLAGPLTAAVALTLIAVMPLYIPYRRAAIEQGMVRTLDSVIGFSASAGAYLASHGRLHSWMWDAAAGREAHDAFFPGIVVVALGLAGAVAWIVRGGGTAKRRIALTLLALCAVGIVLSLGTRTPAYGWLYGVFPPMSGLRAAARFGVLFMLGAAGLAGVGLTALRSRLRPGAAAAVGIAAVLCVTAESLRAPVGYVEFRGIPGLYRLLAREPGPVVLVEVPFYPPQVIYENAEYVLNSTAHWRPLMNGYSGYTPASYRQVSGEFWEFPDGSAVEAMKAAGATHLMVHGARFDADADGVLQRALANPALERLAVGRRKMTLFRIR